MARVVPQTEMILKDFQGGDHQLESLCFGEGSQNKSLT